MKQKKSPEVRVLIGILSVLLLAVSGVLVFAAPTYGYICLAVSSVAVIVICLILMRSQSVLRRMISEIGGALDAENHQALLRFPMPVLVCGEDRKILWYNDLFREQVLLGEDAYGDALDRLTACPLDSLVQSSGCRVSCPAGRFLVCGHCSEHNASPLYLLYFTDVTELSKKAEEYRLTRPTVMILSIDNYAELLQDVKESEKSLILSELDGRMESFIGETTGFLRKLARDRFLAVVEERHIAKMVEQRFPVLDQVRAISTAGGDHMTLSIGVGHGADTLAESEAFARQALEMALGRGGDQVAFKTEQGYDFYGGVSQGVEKRNKVKSRIIAAALQKAVRNADQVLVMGHRFSDLDSVGAAVGMVHIARALGRQAYAVVDRQTSLAVGLIEKAQENLPDLFITPSHARDLANGSTLLIIVDTHNAKLTESEELYRLCPQVMVIDHHRKTVDHIANAAIFFHEPYASSTCEMVTELAQYCSGVLLSANTAECLLAGIMLDTKNFILRTGVRTFEAAAFLRGRGADTVRVRKLFSSSMEAYQKKTRIVASAELYRGCAIAQATEKGEDMRVIAPQAADELLTINPVEASFVLYPISGGIGISGRSLGGMNVQALLEKLGGGGHQTMAAAQLAGVNLSEARSRLIAAIDSLTPNSKE